MTSVHALGDQILNVVLVGTGFVAPIHLRGWSMLDHVSVKAVSSRTRSKAESVAKEFNVPKVYDDFEEMLEKERPNVADICSPVETHLEYIQAAAARGIHVICQKPIAADIETAQQIQQIAEKGGIRLMVHENFRFRVWYRQAKSILESGVIGRPFYCRSDARMAGTVQTSVHPDIPWSIQRQPFFSKLSRFLILESMIHQIDVARYLFGDVKSVYARARKVSSHLIGEDLATLVLDFGTMHAVLERSYASKGHPEPPLVTELMAIEGDRGTLFLERDGSIRVEVDAPGERQTINPEYDVQDAYPNSYAAAIWHFVERMRDGEPFETSIEDNLNTLATTLAAYGSIESGQVVNVRDMVPEKEPLITSPK